MKYLKQFGIILVISFMGEILKAVLPLPVPASIYGILLMFFALYFHVIRLEDVSDTGKFLVEIMPIMFVPAAVGLMESWSVLQPFLAAFAVINVATTILVMAVTGHVTQAVLRLSGKGGVQRKKQKGEER